MTNFTHFRSQWPWLGSGFTAHRRLSLIDLYLNIKLHSNQFFVDGRTDGQMDTETGFLRLTLRGVLAVKTQVHKAEKNSIFYCALKGGQCWQAYSEWQGIPHTDKLISKEIFTNITETLGLVCMSSCSYNRSKLREIIQINLHQTKNNTVTKHSVWVQSPLFQAV